MSIAAFGRRSLRSRRMAPGSSAMPFISPIRQMRQLNEWNREHGWGFSAQAFERLGPPPQTPRHLSGSTVLVLVPSLDTLQQTAGELWSLASSGSGLPSWCPAELHPQTWESDRKWCPGLSWRLIDLQANWSPDHGVRVRNVRSPRISAGVEVLAAAALFPRWLAAIDGSQVPLAAMPAIACPLAGGVTPLLFSGQSEPEVGIGCVEDDELVFDMAFVTSHNLTARLASV